MAVEDVHQLLDLLALSPEVTELSVSGSSGNKVTIKRPAAVLTSGGNFASGRAENYEGEFESGDESPAAKPPVTISATMVGLFHEANPPLANGSPVVVGQIVGYIESMRLMNEVVSTVEGTIDVVVVSADQPVEYGQPLYALTPAA